jgi:hypothetical protein
VEPGKTAELKVSEKFPRAVGEKNKGLIFYRVTQGSQDLLRYSIYFSPVWPKDALAPAAPPSRAFALDGTFNPARSILLLTADAYYLDRPDSATQVTYRVVQAGSSRPVAEGSIDRAVTYYFRKLIELPPLAAGTYTVETLMRREDGKVLGPEKIEFVKADEARRFPEWWNTTVSDTERVIKPFTAMTVNGARVGVWGRTYTLNALGLPAETSSQGKPVSGGAARIVAVVGGKPVAIPIRGAPAFTEKKDWRVAFKGEARGAGLVFSAQGAVEQDGMALVDLTYAPEAGKAVTVDALRIEFPLANDQADCLLCQGAGGNYSSRTTMLLSPDTQGTLWTTLDTGRNGSGMTVGSFYPIVWVGNEQRGFMWCADNDKGWVPDNAVPAHDLVRAGKELVLRNHLIGKPFAVAAPRTVSFSYMASPFRPMVKGWRTAIYSEDGTFEGPNKEVRNEKGEKIVDGWCWLTPPSTNPAAWSGMWAGFKKTADARVRQIQPLDPALARNKYGSTVHTSLPLMGYGWKSPDSRVTDYFAADWAGDSWNKTEQDYFLYIADRAFGEGGLRTIYWDIFFVTHFDTLQNGLAYELPDGRIQPGFNTRNIRRFMMRMYALMEKHGLTPGSQVSHATNCYNLPASAWMDAILDGEYHSVTDESGMDWVDGYPIDRMRVMSVSGQFGPQISWMNLMAFKDKAKGALAYRGFVEYPRLYDTWRGPYGSMPPPVLDWGLNEEQVRYVPFWRNTAATSADASILVSMWQWPDRILLCVFNYDRKDVKDAVLRVDLDALDLVPRLPWQEFVGVRDLDKGDGEPASVLDFHGRMLKVPALKPHTGRLAGIRRY